MSAFEFQEGEEFLKFPLKERKYAKTKLTILQCFLKQLETRSIEEITIKELASLAEVSEPTFYNYYPEKADLIITFIQVWSLQVSIHLLNIQKHTSSKVSGYQILESLLRFTAKQTKKNPKLLLEVISFQTKTKSKSKSKKLSEAEKVLLFPHSIETNKFSILGIDGWIQESIRLAIAGGEISPKANIKKISYAIGSIFFGAPIFAYQTHENLERVWIDALDCIWRGILGSN